MTCMSASSDCCTHRNFNDLTIIAIIATSDLTIIAIIATSDLTIIAIVATQRKTLLKLSLYFL